MKKRFLMSVVVAAALASTVAFADNAVTPTPSIGVVNVEKIFNSSALVKAQKQKLQTEFKVKQQQLQKGQDELKTMVTKYQRDKAVMSQAQAKQMETQMASLQSKLMQMEQTFSQQANNAQGTAMQAFLAKMQVAAQKVAQAKHLQLILPNTSVVYSTNNLDVTADIEAAM